MKFLLNFLRDFSDFEHIYKNVTPIFEIEIYINAPLMFEVKIYRNAPPIFKVKIYRNAPPIYRNFLSLKFTEIPLCTISIKD